ncbi:MULTISPECIES: DUF1992 domain-containing protein [unclassified Brevibacterium]|uniref:DnaJ family domain-containing protein n=1 Tax=unclassified Brevibacterium TaxID=2614124 RepID=UPI000C38B1EE|nr:MULTISPECIES: DUF1992 domain-containing protein [unclassified Brevibacterium]SMY04308.1 protein of unknown function (DUF1992) [Brevibacterium sp. 239c]
MTEEQPPRRIGSIQDRNAIVESALDKAIRRGDFENLPGLGKPLTGLHNSEDPDWWIKQKMEREELSGVAPAAFQLRKENAVLEDTLDAFSKEADVRDYLAGFNARVREAVMDLREGPPVFTPPRKVDEEIIAWRQRREARHETQNPHRAPTAEQPPRRWWRRRRS